ncbi:peptidase inhibitor family I36 protein [Kitasatospora sp. NPDC056138]|uniref:peptidase inhibitor family I36 protein n=1 Tax=Kitasatospora sp. NPDC056138 TaxID=3345724 RepID=UPI0035D7F6B6
MRHRAIRLAVVAATASGLAATTAPATHADTGRAPEQCRKGYFCLWEGPHQTGRLLFAEDAHVTKEGFRLAEQDDIEPSVHPRSARNPLPDDFGCIVRLNDRPDFGGDEQEVAGFGDHELDGRRVGSLTSDCG